MPFVWKISFLDFERVCEDEKKKKNERRIDRIAKNLKSGIHLEME